jgi:hypothetical protein
MDIIQTCETIELWINSCKTVEQLDLLEEAMIVFFYPVRFPEISIKELKAHEDVLNDKSKYRKEQLKFTPVLTNQ